MVPLADRLRPKKLEEIIGQKHILASDKLLFKAIKSGNLFSMILWGPPGVGKTTLARVIASEISAHYLEFSAVTASIADLKKIFEQIKLNKDVSLGNRLFPEDKPTSSFSKDTIVFIDEIHRFNKSQQDSLLPYVENGTITLIGATTENPSFEVISPLLSRTRVFTLQQLSKEDLVEVIDRALKDKQEGYGKLKIQMDEEALEFIIEAANGDARKILNTLEIAISSFFDNIEDINSSKISTKKSPLIIDKSLLEEALQKKSLRYDKLGEEHYDTISAFIKSMRASNVDAAVYYLARMVEAGEDPLFIARRMVIFASEDIGMAQPTALVVANEVFRACETIGYPECQINLAHGVVYLATAKKDRSAYEAYFEALSDVQTQGNLPIPMELRNAPTKLMKELGYGKGYEKYTDKSLLPDKLKGKKYFKGEQR